MQRMYAVFVLAIVVACAPLTSLAIDYFPTDPDPVYNYEYGSVTVSVDSSGVIWRNLAPVDLDSSTMGFRIDASGDVQLWTYRSFCPVLLCADDLVYMGGVVYLDFPLDAGKTWSTNTLANWVWIAQIFSVSVTGTVVGPRTVTVPAGEFDVIVVSLAYHYDGASWLDHVDELWLQRQLGPVNDLVSWTGVVGEATTSWGDVKLLFR